MDVLDDLLKKQRSLKYLKYDAKNTLQLQRVWPDISGDILSKQLTVSYIRGKLLVLEASNPCWKQEIDFYKIPLLKKVNDELGLKVSIEWIRVELAEK